MEENGSEGLASIISIVWGCWRGARAGHLGAEEGKPEERRHQAGGGWLLLSQSNSALSYQWWSWFPHSPTWAGVTVTNQFICELSPSTRRKKKMQREPLQLQAKGREDAMCLASPAVVCSCFALSCLLQLKPKQTALPAGANRKEVIGRGVVLGGQRLPSGSWASWGPQCPAWGHPMGSVPSHRLGPGKAELLQRGLC